jgi:hypothetical protein
MRSVAAQDIVHLGDLGRARVHAMAGSPSSVSCQPVVLLCIGRQVRLRDLGGQCSGSDAVGACTGLTFRCAPTQHSVTSCSN